jgi:phage baseplate assembly protein W
MEDASFLGRGLKFPLAVDPKTGKIALSSGEADIAEAIEIIIRTALGERVMRPRFGSTAESYLFAAAGSGAVNALAADLREQIAAQEPRITDLQVKCHADKALGGLIADISYAVRTTNSRHSKVFPFYLEEGDVD